MGPRGSLDGAKWRVGGYHRCRPQSRGWNMLQRELPCHLPASCWLRRCGLCPPLCCAPSPLLSQGLAHQGLLVLELGCDVPLLREQAAELNKVTSNLCLQPHPWGESLASWHSQAEHIHFPWQGSRGQQTAGPTCTSTPGRPAWDHMHCALPSRLDTG